MNRNGPRNENRSKVEAEAKTAINLFPKAVQYSANLTCNLNHPLYTRRTFEEKMQLRPFETKLTKSDISLYAFLTAAASFICWILYVNLYWGRRVLDEILYLDNRLKDYQYQNVAEYEHLALGVAHPMFGWLEYDYEWTYTYPAACSVVYALSDRARSTNSMIYISLGDIDLDSFSRNGSYLEISLTRLAAPMTARSYSEKTSEASCVKSGGSFDDGVCKTENTIRTIRFPSAQPAQFGKVLESAALACGAERRL